MYWLKWLPWRFVIRQVARSQGYLDPLALASRLLKFSQPSEVDVPLELMRAGAVFHARGLVNSRVIQHNLDWVWPYWAERQFDPESRSFVPRAFSITHVNLTHRNWTAVGCPDYPQFPIVDPCGLVTPFWDGWSLEAWILTDDGFCLIPQRTKNLDQRLDLQSMAVITEVRSGGLALKSEVLVEMTNLNGGQADAASIPVCQWQIQAFTDCEAWLVLSLRPQNPEGVSFVHKVLLEQGGRAWLVDGENTVNFNLAVDHHYISNYVEGDVHIHLQDREEQKSGKCDVGMVTAAALFKLKPNQQNQMSVTVPLQPESGNHSAAPVSWDKALTGHCQLQCPDRQFQFLYDAAIRSLVLLSPKDVFPGPYTYKRFWFRDAAIIVYGLLCAGLTDRAQRALEQFPARQQGSGYFCSQDGEWDSNGEVLWILQRFSKLTGKSIIHHRPQQFTQDWTRVVRRGAKWIINKRVNDDDKLLHSGLMPAGFSAEHLGPNDFYYWDNFWSIAGLHAAGELLRDINADDSERFLQQADDLTKAVDKSLLACAQRLQRLAMPASPYRRMDAGAIGSIVAAYPLQLYSANDSRVMDTVEFLLERCFIKGAFFQDMIHSGLNAYLTLQVAQVLLRAGDNRYLTLMDTVADLASPTGQWPEAIHPHTLGGCMGDGHHAWASSEWVLMIRYCFVREEGAELVLCSGIPMRWLQSGKLISFGPAPTEFGTITITVKPDSPERVNIDWQANWFDNPPTIRVALPGFTPVNCADDGQTVTVKVEKLRS